MKSALAIFSTFAILMAEALPQGGYSSGGFGGSGSGGSSGYSSFGGGNSIGGAPSQNYGAPGGFGVGNSAPGQSYGAPGQNSFGDNGSGTGSGSGSDAAQGPQTFRHISVHTAPADPDDEEQKIVRVPGGGNKHVNIIFVKAPSGSGDAKTEIVLPEPDEHKQLVYVLVQKTDPAANLKIRRPQQKQPAKPEVYFIRYKNAQQQGQSGQGSSSGSGSNGNGVAGAIGIGGYSRDASVNAGGFSSAGPAYGAPSSQYGAP